MAAALVSEKPYYSISDLPELRPLSDFLRCNGHAVCKSRFSFRFSGIVRGKITLVKMVT